MFLHSKYVDVVAVVTAKLPPFASVTLVIISRRLRPMSHLQFYRAILSRDFIVRQNRV